MPKPGPATRNGIKALDLYCRKTNARNLKRLSLSIGAALGTNKSILRENILSQAAALEELRYRRQKNGTVSVLSIDAGISNFAFTRFSWPLNQELPSLIDWKKIQLRDKFMSPGRKEMSLHPEDTSQVIYELTEYLTTELPLPDVFTIERQRARSMSSRTILEPILKVNILEQVLFSNLRCKARLASGSEGNYLVASSDPQRMTSYWCSLTPIRKPLGQNFPKGSEEAQMKMSSNRLSKSIKINLVKRILEGALGYEPRKLISLTPSWEQRLRSFITGNHKFKLWDCAVLGPDAGVRKDDDLADSFLHGLAWMEWLRAYEEVFNIVMKEQGSYDQNVLADFNDYCKNKKLELEKFQKGTSDNLTDLELEEK
ncbi:cruciform cutting endonuclease TDEL_0B07420 [Torulaspora delbrueckii]|uniref:Mitochondrial resolvase Ydc2 catalytic domain-containing protein n=1 Tax=Torulaspora delbrueckii TaxID=4950 RepID=G8ZQH7_TORDE|nr:hypothetical protein TDEL_0B07420 [Torulaspora delbrueckii]CCE90871.1 hypothetical protein TDEL_0B07420 [Torulaspora delbrueckii]